MRAKMLEVILGMSGCRTPITEVHQSGPTSVPTADGWGCEITTTSQQTKCLAGLHTDVNGVITGTIQGISTAVNTSIVTMVPLTTPTGPAIFTSKSSQTLYGWRGGAAGDGTTVPMKYLPSSCRG